MSSSSLRSCSSSAWFSPSLSWCWGRSPWSFCSAVSDLELHGSGRARRRLWQWCVLCWFCWLWCTSRCFPFGRRQAQTLRIKAGMLEKDSYAARCPHAVVHTPVVCNDKCLGFSSAENCGFSEVSAHLHGHEHPCHDAEAVSHGPACLVDHRDSPVARRQGARCPGYAGRALFP